MFNSYDNANEVSKDYLLSEFNGRRTLDLDAIHVALVTKWGIGFADVIQEFHSKVQFEKKAT